MGCAVAPLKRVMCAAEPASEGPSSPHTIPTGTSAASALAAVDSAFAERFTDDTKRVVMEGERSVVGQEKRAIPLEGKSSTMARLFVVEVHGQTEDERLTDGALHRFLGDPGTGQSLS